MSVAHALVVIVGCFRMRLTQANIKKDKEILEEVNQHLRAMRDTWKQVMEANKQ
mgnify:CR=1 FL=1